MRVLGVATKTALLNAPRLNMTWLVRILAQPPINAIYLCSSRHTVSWAGNEWLGAGELLNIEFPEEDASLEAKAGEITLNGLDPALVSLAMNTHLEGAVVHVWMLLRDPDNYIPIEQPTVVYRGTISEIRISQPYSGEGE
jgi:hypothetical protein